MRTNAYFSILFSLNVYKKPKFSKKNMGFPVSLPEFPDVGKIRKNPEFTTFSSYWDSYCSKFQVKSMIGTKVMAKSFCEDLTRNFRKVNGWFQLMANNIGCGHVNSTKIFTNVCKRPIINVNKYEVQSANRKKVFKWIFNFSSKKCWRYHFLHVKVIRFYISDNYLW